MGSGFMEYQFLNIKVYWLQNIFLPNMNKVYIFCSKIRLDLQIFFAQFLHNIHVDTQIISISISTFT